MQISVESTTTLERKMTIGVPADRIESAVNTRLQEVAKDVRLDGFRQGKVPMKVVRQRFGLGARQEILGKIINDTFYEAIQQEDLNPAGMPSIEPVKDEPGTDFEYVATFEVYPEVELEDFAKLEITRLKGEITDADIEDMIENLRGQQAAFEEVDRAAKDGDEVDIDYTGVKDGEEFEGGKAEGSKLILGSGQMIPGFEDGIIGMKAGEEKVVSLTFPEEYHSEDLKGAAVEFTIKLNKVSEKKLAELDEEFFKKFGVEEGGEEKFREEVKTNMQREMDIAAANKLKKQVYDGLVKLHELEIPAALIDQEIANMRQNMVQQFGGQMQGMDLESLLPAEMFQDQAKERVTTGLVMNEIINSKQLKADADAVRAKVEEMAATYGDPEQVINHYYSDQNLLNQVEAVVLDDLVVETVMNDAKIEDKAAGYKEVIAQDPPQGAEDSEDGEE